MAAFNSLQLVGLGLNVFGTAIIFLFAYPPTDERGRRSSIALTRAALLLMFSGFVLQFLAVYKQV